MCFLQVTSQVRLALRKYLVLAHDVVPRKSGAVGRSLSAIRVNKPSILLNAYTLYGIAKSPSQKGRLPPMTNYELWLRKYSFLKELQEENKTLKRKRPETTATIPAATKCLDRRVPIESSSMGAEIVSNAPDGRADNGLDLVPDETSIQPQYIGEAACTTFVRRLKQHINGYQRPPR